MINAQIKITGVTALLMHSDQLADPLWDGTKAMKRISSKRTKTDADHESMAEMEFRSALYLDADGAVAIPYRNIVKCLIEGARITKSGAKVERGLAAMGTDFTLTYPGSPLTPADLYSRKEFVSRMSVKVGQQRVMRVRPMFRQWGLTVDVMTDPAVLGIEELADIAMNAGQMVGLGDYRKGGGFGRFNASVSLI